MKTVRATLALAVAFWMAGGGCMLGCESMTGASAHSAEATLPANAATPDSGANIVVAADACASMQGHGCCAKRRSQSIAKHHAGPASSAKGSSKLVTSRSALATKPTVIEVVAELAAPFSSMMDCPLAVNATAALSKARPDDSGGDLPQTLAADSYFFLSEQLTALTPPPRLPNRGHTYLRCCVFLI